VREIEGEGEMEKVTYGRFSFSFWLETTRGTTAVRRDGCSWMHSEGE